MKKDIDTLLAEERAEIIAKYDKVSVCTAMPSPNSDSTLMTFMINTRNALEVS